LWVGGCTINIVLASLAFVFFLSPMLHRPPFQPGSPSRGEGVNGEAPRGEVDDQIPTGAGGEGVIGEAPPGPDTSFATATSVAEGTTLSGSLVPGQARHFFQFTASRSKIRVIVRKRSQDGFQGAVDVYDQNKKRVAQAHEGVSLLSGIHPQDQPLTLVFKSRPGELYYIAVAALGSNARGDYELTVREE
jgi:hypothetical protein